MGGAWSAAQIILAFRAIGYENITIDSEEVTEAYARKWGHGLAIRDYIQSSLIYAEKPLEGKKEKESGKARVLARGKFKSGRVSKGFSATRPAVASTDADEKAAQETGDVSPPGDPTGPLTEDA